MESAQEQSRLVSQGIRWLYEMELVDDPQLLNNLKMNILMTSRCIADLELLSLHKFGRKEMLIWLDLNWLGTRFFSVRIIEEVRILVNKLLPEFKIRVVSDRHILDLAIKNITTYLDRKPVEVASI